MKLTPELPTFGKTILILKTMSYNSSFTSQEVEQRLLQGYYDDIVEAGIQGGVIGNEENVTKGQLDLSLAKTLKGQGGITKEQVEEVLTGTIKSHNHDTEYEIKEYETDVWDGTNVSTSLEGSGIKDDPYLIQSCADWLYLRANSGKYNVNSIGGDTENKSFAPYFKINKNLDFGNKAIPELDTEGSTGSLLMCVFDGNKAKLSNFVDSQGTGILPPSVYYFAHDFVIENFQRTVVVSSLSEQNIPIFSTMDIYSAILSCTVNANITITGNVSKSTTISTVTASEYPLVMGNNFATYINNYVESNGCFGGININITDNTTKSNDAKIVALFAPYFISHPISLYCTAPLDDVNVHAGEQPQEDFAITMMILGVQPAGLYTNSDGANTIYFLSDEGDPTPFAGTPKSLTEMQSASFVEELNSLLPKPAFMKDPEGGTPVLAQFGGIKYDGYVKQSEFESFKKNMPSAVNPNDFIYELKPEVYVFTADSTSEEISAAVGGESGVKEIIQAVKNGKRLVIRGTNDEMENTTINQDVQCSAYQEEDNGDMGLVLYGYGYYLWGGTGGLLNIKYTKSSNTFSCEVLTV